MFRLSKALREKTARDHRRAEQTGIVQDILEGRVTALGYKIYLRNLYEVYEILEAALTESSVVPPELSAPALFRAPSIATDLRSLAGEQWNRVLPVLEAATEYRARIESVSCDVGALVGHSYVRYLGDLSGGQLLASHLSRHLNLATQQLAFYRFDIIDDIPMAKRRFRRALDEFGTSIGQPRTVIAEAQRAFRLNIDLSCSVKQAVDTCAESP